MLIEIPPKHAVSAVAGYSKGKSAIATARTYLGKQDNCIGQNFREQEVEDKRQDQLEMFKDGEQR